MIKAVTQMTVPHEQISSSQAVHLKTIGDGVSSVQDQGAVYRRLLDGPLPGVSIYEASDFSTVQTTRALLSTGPEG